MNLTNAAIKEGNTKETVVKFSRKDKTDFFPTLRKRVDQYFKENNLSKHANSTMIIKTIFILTGFVGTYLLLLSNWFSVGQMLVLAILNGLFTALIGLNITHDAMHGSYSSNKNVNYIIGLCFNIIGANDYMWKISHNVMHHTFTNVPGQDADIDQVPVLRLNPQQELWWIHRFQYIYTFFFYALTSIAWVFVRDFAEYFHPKVAGYKRTDKPVREFLRMIFFKIIYYILFLVIPFMVIDLPWHYILIGFIILHMVEGIALALVFQLAHVVEGTHFPSPDEDGQLGTSWEVHQMYTTADFACENKLVNYFFGGLNFQVEHHLFPHICHVHYTAIAPIVKQTAEEYGLPYYSHPTYFGAIRSHIRMLKKFGRGEEVPLNVG